MAVGSTRRRPTNPDPIFKPAILPDFLAAARNEEYRSIFEDIYRRYDRLRPLLPLPPWEAHGRLRSQIESATEREGLVGRIRADAKVFSLINLYEMFILPVALRGIDGRAQAVDDVWGNLSADLVTIFQQP